MSASIPAKSIDPTAIAVVQRIPNANGKPTFRCGHLERLPLATPYPGVVQHVRRLVGKEPFLGQSELVLDLTGVGRPVADLFQAEGLRPVKVSITAGDNETLNEQGIWHVAKLLLVSTVQALLHDGRLQIQKDLPEAPILKLELEDFRATVTDSGRWTFGARSGAHDDLVLALALAPGAPRAAPRCMSILACWLVRHCCAPATIVRRDVSSRTVSVAGASKEKLTYASFNPSDDPR